MRTAHDFNEAMVIERALEHPCPNCGARVGVRCRILTPYRTTRTHPKVDVLQKPHPERCTLAWREMLAEEVG